MSASAQVRSFNHGRWKLSLHNGTSKLLKPFLPIKVAKISSDHAAQLAKHSGSDPKDVENYLNFLRNIPHFSNGTGADEYIVSVEENVEQTGRDMFWLSGRRNDNFPVNDWRDLQEIKNMIFGPDYEAVQLFPAEDRVVDEANQFHLWVSRDPHFRFPFGYREGSKVYKSPPLPGRQRPFGER